MAKLPGLAKTFARRWRIVEVDTWDNDFLDLVGQAHLTFKGKSNGDCLWCAEGFCRRSLRRARRFGRRRVLMGTAR